MERLALALFVDVSLAGEAPQTLALGLCLLAAQDLVDTLRGHDAATCARDGVAGGALSRRGRGNLAVGGHGGGAGLLLRSTRT